MRRFHIIHSPILLCETSSARITTVVLHALNDIALTAKHLMLDIDLVNVR